MINPANLEESETFKQIHQYKSVSKVVPRIIEEFGDYGFTRSHVASAVAELTCVRKRPIAALDETVRQELLRLLAAGKIQKTGEKKFGRDVYRRAV